ncbi:MAG: ATP-binding protein [Fuerstiella sp.]
MPDNKQYPTQDNQGDQADWQMLNEELKRAQEELHRTTTRFQDLWNHAPIGYILHTDTGQIIIANRRAELLLQKNEALARGGTLHDFLTPQSSENFSQHLTDVGNSEASHEVEVQLKGKADRWLQLESIATSTNEIRTALFDISKQKQAELDGRKLTQQLQQTQKMEVLHELSAGIAHDFNNILQVIMTYGEFVLEDLDEIGANTDSISSMLAGAERGADLTRRLLAFSRKSSLQAEIADLGEIASNAAEVVRRTLGELISVRARLPVDCVTVCVDRNLIEQAILNLCVNARDAMPKGGHIEIALEEIRFDEPVTFTGITLPPGSYAALSISDDGIGMPESVLEKAFEPFFTTKDIGSGTGLGLSIVYGITRQHHGAIESLSTRGQGACFRIYLPLKSKPIETKHPPKPITPNPAANHFGTILLAEDEVAIRQVIGRSLRTAGYTVFDASDGEEAIQLIRDSQASFDLLLTDAVMPGYSGKDVCEAFRKKWPETPVIMLSGHGDRVVDNKFLNQHSATLLAKPIPSRELLQIVQRMIHPALDSVPS